jgi:preprotein translocase subunit SecD
VSLKKNVGWLVLVLGVLLAIYIPVIIKGWSPKLGLDLEGGISITMQAVGETDSGTMDKAAEIIRNRINALGLTEPVVAAEGDNRVLVQIPGEKDMDRVKKVVGSTAQLQFRQVLEILTAGDPAYDTTEVTRVVSTDEQAYQALKDQEVVLTSENNGNVYKIRLSPTRLTGDIISSATAEVDKDKGGWMISFNLTDAATKSFADLTTELQGQTSPLNQLAIVLDYKIESYPSVNQAITEGKGQITGSFDKQRAQDLALVLKLGALPVDFIMEKSEVVSPTLGRESLDKGLIAGFIGLMLVALYMLVIYRGLGVVALGQLALFGALTYGIICLLGNTVGWTLTLAGIAGIIVSIGISADSSVVYFERLKEEARMGKTIRSSADRAFKNSFRTVIAADFTTFIAALILWMLAIGPVRGFAFTLGLSTVLDVFINYCFTHNIVVLAGRLKIFRNPAMLGVGREAQGEEA